MPAGLVNKQGGVSAGRDLSGDLGEMQVHRLRVTSGQNERRALALFWTDRAEDVGRRRALIVRGARPRAPLGPSSRDLVLLPNARLVLEPNLYCLDSDGLFARDFIQARRESFLKSSITPSAWAWWRGRAESLR